MVKETRHCAWNGYSRFVIEQQLFTYKKMGAKKVVQTRGGELGVLRVREHPLNKKVHPLTTKSTP